MTEALDPAANAVVRLQAEKAAAYHERNQLVAALSRLFPSHLCRHPDEDKEWEDDWRWVVCVHIQEARLVVFGDMNNAVNDRWRTFETQVTWHIHHSELPLFDHLRETINHWDGHTTAEKYDRLYRISAVERPYIGYWTRLWRALVGR